jgi:hypothetical protein
MILKKLQKLLSIFQYYNTGTILKSGAFNRSGEFENDIYISVVIKGLLPKVNKMLTIMENKEQSHKQFSKSTVVQEQI